MMKLVILFLSIVASTYVAAEGKLNIWEEIKDKNLSDLIYREKGEIISIEFNYHPGLVIIYHVMSKKVLYKCTDELDDGPADDGKAESSNCYKLK